MTEYYRSLAAGDFTGRKTRTRDAATGGVDVATRKILVVRNDKLGDFTLALPVFDLLKRNLPESRLVALVPAYTGPLAKMSEAVDDVIIDPGPGNPGGSAISLATRLRKEKFSAVITLYSTVRVGIAVRLAGIPYRLSPATKLAQVFYNHRLPQRRSKSIKPEYEYNLDLARSFLTAHDQLSQDCFTQPVIRLSADKTRTRQMLSAELGLSAERRWVVMHPQSGGSAGNLSQQQYAELGRGLLTNPSIALLITAGPGEADYAIKLQELIGSPDCAVYQSRGGLQRFIEVLATADLFIGSSTGPLHLAGALDIPTAGFYPRRTTGSPLRWQTLNQAERRLAFVPPATADERDVDSIDVSAAATQISVHFLAASGS